MGCLTVTTQLHTGIMSFYGCYSMFSTQPLKSCLFFFLCADDNILSSCVHKCVICCEHKMIILCTRDNNLCAQDNISCSQKKEVIFWHFRGSIVFWLFLWLQQHAAVSLKGNELGIPRIYLSGICNIAYRHHGSLAHLFVCRCVMWTNIFCQTLSCRQDKYINTSVQKILTMLGHYCSAWALPCVTSCMLA